MRPAVSLYVPCYNGALWLAECLDALLAQTRPADEVLVVDDGSTDATAAIAGRYAGRVRLVAHAANRGLAVARNTALAAAGGEIVASVDADVRVTPTWLERLLTAFTSPRVVAAGGAWKRRTGSAWPTPGGPRTWRNTPATSRCATRPCCPERTWPCDRTWCARSAATTSRSAPTTRTPTCSTACRPPATSPATSRAPWPTTSAATTPRACCARTGAGCVRRSSARAPSATRTGSRPRPPPTPRSPGGRCGSTCPPARGAWPTSACSSCSPSRRPIWPTPTAGPSSAGTPPAPARSPGSPPGGWRGRQKP